MNNQEKKQTWWDKLTPEERKRRNKEKIEKFKKTCMEKYGVENPSQNKIVQEKKKQTCLKNYGVEYPYLSKIILKKIKKGFLDKYGVENPYQAEEVKEKIKQTCLERYGVEYSLQSSEVRDKGKQTCMEKYGVEYSYQAEEVKEKIKQTCLERYGVENGAQSKDIQEKIRSSRYLNTYQKLFKSVRFTNEIEPLFTLEEYKGVKKEYYKFKCKKCGTQFGSYLQNGHIPRCFKCHPVSNFTIPHQIICDLLDNFGIVYEIEKHIKPYFVDIFIKPNKIIEVYGDYWHGNPKFYEEGSELNLPTGKIKVEEKWEKDKNRKEYLQEQGYKILTIWEDDIKNDLESIEQIIKDMVK
jgi:G:T-mismatch repair DNA endonuclease (very short patch repair protein)/glutathione peroxidase-family protein